MINVILGVTTTLIVFTILDHTLARRVKKNKYEPNDYVYVKTIGGPLLARVEKVVWESSVSPLVDGPIYYLYYVESETRTHLLESAILCKFKGERLITNE